MTRSRIRASELRTPFQLLARGSTQATNGEEIVVWAPFAWTYWGRIMAAYGREVTHARGTVALATHRIRLRYAAEIKPKLRLSHGGRTYEILAALDPDGRKVAIDCDVVEVVS